MIKSSRVSIILFTAEFQFNGLQIGSLLFAFIVYEKPLAILESGWCIEPPPTRYNPFITFSTPLVLTTFLMTFATSGCIGLSKHSSQTPWGALGIAINNDTPTIGLGGADTGSSTGSGTGSGTSTGTGTGTGSGSSTNTGTGTGGSTVSSGQTGFGTPGQGGGSTGSGSNGAGTPVAGMIFFHNDQIGSTKLMTNSAGEMVTGSNGAANIVYNPYGDIDVDHSHGPDILRNKFTGQQLDNESGLYYYNARYYDPALGRFISADSVMDTGGANGMNRYMYTNGNPVLRNDPSGHDAPKWMENMNKDIKQAMVESVVQQAGAPLTLAYMMKTSRDRSHYEGKAGRALENPGAWFDRQVVNPIQHMNTTELVIGTVIFVAAVVATIAFAAITGLTGGAGFLAGIAVGIAITYMGKALGRTLAGYSDSNLRKAKWNSSKADRGEKIGGDAASFGNAVGGLFQFNGDFETMGVVDKYSPSVNWNDFSADSYFTNPTGPNPYQWSTSSVLGDLSGKEVEKNYGSQIRNYTDNANLQNWQGHSQISHIDNIYKQRTPYYWYSGNQRNVEFMAKDLFTGAVGNDMCNGCKY